MVRRLLTQFGLATLALTLAGTGIALADTTASPSPTAPAGSTQPTFQGDLVSVQTSGNGSVQIQTSQSTTQTTGAPGKNGDDGGGTLTGQSNSGNANTSTGGGNGAPPANFSTNSLPGAGILPGSNVTPSTPGGTSDTDTAAQQSLQQSQFASAGGSDSGQDTQAATTGSTLESWHQVVARMNALPHPPQLQAVTAAGLPRPQPPTAPSGAATFFLSQLPLLLQQVVVPLTQGASMSLPLGGSLPTFGLILVVLLGLRGLTALIPANSYTAGLRRSGFLGAPRSDVGWAPSFFATPREMGCIFATAT